MKNTFLLFLIGLFTFSISQTAAAQSDMEGEWCWMARAKYKPGKAQEAIAIGKKYFSPAYEAAGYEVELFEFISSEWDVIIAIPLKDGVQEYVNMPPKKVVENLIKNAGGEEKLQEITAKYNAMIAHERADIVKRTN